MFEEKVIDLHESVDTTRVGDGVVTVADSMPYSIGIGILTVAFFVILILFYRKMWELHERVFESGTRMPRIQTKRAIGSAAFRFAKKAQSLAEKEADSAVAETMRKLGESLHQFGVHRVVSDFEAPGMLRDIERSLCKLPRTDHVKAGARTELLTQKVTEYVDLTDGVSEQEGTQQNIDNVMYACVQAIKKVPDTVSEDMIIKVLEKARLRLESARQRCLTEAPMHQSLDWHSRLKNIKAGDFQIPKTEAPLAEMIRVVNETRDAINKLRPLVVASDQGHQRELFVQELRDWIEVTRSLAYAPWWSIEAHMWFLGRG
jgi:hypothetical protein